MKPRIKVDFIGFWDGFNKTDNWFWHTLRRGFDPVLADQPEFLFFSDGSSRAWQLHVCTRIYFSVERHLPDWRQCDFALTCHEMDDPRNLRLPYYVVESDPATLVKPDGWAEQVVAEARKFCGLMISNPRAKRGQRRMEFVQRLMARSPVDSGGRWNNTIGGPLKGGFPAKRAWLRGYRYNVAFENEALTGYTTEKITDAMVAGCVPVYWGNPTIEQDFNRKSFLNLADFASDDALIDRMEEISRDDAALGVLLREPWFAGNRPNQYYSADRFLEFIERVTASKETPVARRHTWMHPGRWALVKRNRPPPPPW